jgi:hypothetical protein
MIDYTLYLSDVNNLSKVMRLTDLSLDEIELIVGRFNNNSHRAGLLRGELVITFDKQVSLRHHFTKKIIWNKD